MPTGSESIAGARAHDEAELWLRTARAWAPTAGRDPWGDALAPVERQVIPEVDPVPDLEQRAGEWGFTIIRADLVELSRFAGALAATEADAWRAGNGILATRAYADRRFLFSDRILPWAVPWLMSLADSVRSVASVARATRDEMLELGEHHRVSPQRSGEGLHPPGHDGYGPIASPLPARDRVRSLWGGLARVDPARVANRAPELLAAEYVQAVTVWEALRDRCPGSAGYWHDLAMRAHRTVATLSGGHTGGPGSHTDP